MNCERPYTFNDSVLSRNGAMEFSIVTYNILADCHVQKKPAEFYSYVKKEHLLKDNGVNSARHKLLLQELDFLDSDIVLLQEVDDWYAAILLDNRKEKGYEGVFMSQALGVPEGLIVCYKKEKFARIETHKLNLHDDVTSLGSEAGLSKDDLDYLLRETVSLIVVLKHKQSGKLLVCGNIHGTFDGYCKPALQALQACIPCKRMHQIRSDLAKRHGVPAKSIGLLYGGDFNGEPDHMNVEVVKNGKLTAEQQRNLKNLSYKFVDRKPVRTVSETPCIVAEKMLQHLCHPLQLHSAYEVTKGHEPTITTAENSCIGAVDYIFFTPDLSVTSVLDVTSTTHKEYTKGGPTYRVASDHLPLKATFSIQS